LTKTGVQLRMAGLAYRKTAAGLPPASPKGQLPYIDDEGRSIADSTFIARISSRNTASISTRAWPAASARQAWAFERMIEHHVYWGLIGARWVDPDNFAKGPAHFFDGATGRPPRKAQGRRAVPCRREYFLSGLGRHAPETTSTSRCAHSMALSLQIGDKPYLMGDKPCGIDATRSARSPGS